MYVSLLIFAVSKRRVKELRGSLPASATVVSGLPAEFDVSPFSSSGCWTWSCAEAGAVAAGCCFCASIVAMIAEIGGATIFNRSETDPRKDGIAFGNLACWKAERGRSLLRSRCGVKVQGKAQRYTRKFERVLSAFAESVLASSGRQSGR